MKMIAYYCVFLSLFSLIAKADTVSTTVSSTDNAKILGSISFMDTPHGLLIVPQIKGLLPGLHGHPSCEHQGTDAGAHYDPQQTNTHQGPYANGHLGDLPVLYVNNDGTATTPTLAPRLTTQTIQNLAVIIHAGSDNYSDNPPLGGGGSRIGCGLIGK